MGVSSVEGVDVSVISMLGVDVDDPQEEINKHMTQSKLRIFCMLIPSHLHGIFQELVVMHLTQ